MLEFYYDDSGTHGHSNVIVWGGVSGHKQIMDELDKAWSARLARPTGNRPPISKFRMYDLMHAQNEFEGYSEGEKLRVRRNFRKCIVDSGASVIAYAISRRDWDAVATPAAKLILAGAERTIFGVAVMESCKIAEKYGEPISFIFDKGRSPQLDSIIAPAIEAADFDPNRVSYGFRTVASVNGLQAADLVAYEAYQFGCDYLEDNSADPNPHMRALLDQCHDHRIGWIGRDQIQAVIDGTADMVKKLGLA
ncbi:DUF3800 domain-containing protein [Erythrobacter sp. W302b]|uniref:DUF3800 domain-containing protein n=1 Tax=Erythrobacter sp. W302b TaxID=3389874 RepID=UPI00396B3DBB